MHVIVKLALQNTLKDLLEHQDTEKALEEIAAILLLPDDTPVFRYELQIQTEKYHSELFLLHTENISVTQINEMISKDKNKSPVAILLKNGFKLAPAAEYDYLEKEDIEIDLHLNKEGGA